MTTHCKCEAQSAFIAGLEESQHFLMRTAEALNLLSRLLNASGELNLTASGMASLISSVECDAITALDELNVVLRAQR